MNFSYDDIGQRVTFEIYGSSVIGGNYTDVEIVLVSAASGVAQYDPRQKHEAIYSLLPEPRPQTHTEYKYYLIRHSNGRQSIVGDAWIKADTVIRGSMNKIVLEISDVTPSDIGKLKNLLRAEGYNVTKAAIATV